MKFGNLNIRQAGILLPVSSLPGRHGIGDLGPVAYDFIDLTVQSGFKIWQMLPLNPSSAGNSPYTPYSSYAGDEIYISLELLEKWGLLKDLVTIEHNYHVDYNSVKVFKRLYLKEAYKNFKKTKELYEKEYKEFLDKAFWLDEYAKFMALNHKNHGKPWTKWSKKDQDLPDYTDLEDEINYHKFVQYVFMKQFFLLKDYAHEQGLSIMGDMPLYVGLDSADVYSNRKCFLLDDSYTPLFVSGASPDYFSKEGQLWDHPIYDWKYLKQTDYKFWVNRFAWNNAIFDILRIDHFRAFDTYWSIPQGSKTAVSGKWIEGPSYDFFDSLYKQLPNLNIIVEDLGELREEVHQLRDHYNLIGMKIMQFSFGEEDASKNYAMKERCVVYTGTHDNSPLMGWYHGLSESERNRITWIIDRYHYPEWTLPERILHRAFDCESIIAICQYQDLFRYGEDTRLNVPGTLGDHNWSYKLKDLNDFRNGIYTIRKLLQQTNRL